jgi:Mg2+-importing ATPase
MKHFVPWTTKDVNAVLHELTTRLEGLSAYEVQERLAEVGPNHIDIKSESFGSLLLRQMRSPFNYLLMIAAGIECIIGEFTNATLIAILTGLNVCIGFFQEYKAHKAVLLLHRFIPSMTTVMREGKKVSIARDSLVPGDILVLNPGAIVPADARIIEGIVFIDESTLTGESEPATKNLEPLQDAAQEIFKASNIVFAGTNVVGGDCKAVVIATGNNTIFYTITAGGQADIKLSSYEKGIVSLSRMILRFVIVTIALIFIAKQLLGTSIGLADELVFFITLIVAIVPEALPTVVAFSLSQGALKLVRNHVVVKRLTAIDDLGDIEILCTDKTGTITELHLSVDTIVSTESDKCLLFLLMDTKAQSDGIASKGPFDDVLLAYASQEIKDLLKNYKVLQYKSFDSSRMRATILVKDESGSLYVIVKGAPEVILSLSTSIDGNDPVDIIHEKINAYGRDGKRVLAVAYKRVSQETLTDDIEKEFHFVGFIALNNPIKQGVSKTIDLARRLGVEVKMITGDTKEVAGFVGKQVGLVQQQENVITGAELAILSHAEFKQKCFEYDIFARVDPETKAGIINSLQETHKVGFMGDGVNDVPALKKANVAIVVQEASDIARAVSDIILLKRDLQVVVSGIRQGRVTFSNINKYLQCTLAGNFGNYYSLAFFSLIISFLPMLPTQILLINLLSDFPLIAIASDNVDIADIRRPKSYSLVRMLPLMFLLGFVGTLSDVLFFATFYRTSPDMFRSLWFVLNILSDLVLIYSIRSSQFFLRATRPSWLLIAASICSAIICIWLPYSVLGHAWFSFVSPVTIDMIKVLGIVVVYGFMTEWAKIQYYKYIAKQNNHANV